MEDDEWVEALERLDTLIRKRSDSDILAWLKAHVPRCLALIPRRRLQTFLGGLYRYVIFDGNQIEF
jgi:hypothetical protein